MWGGVSIRISRSSFLGLSAIEKDVVYSMDSLVSPVEETLGLFGVRQDVAQVAAIADRVARIGKEGAHRGADSKLPNNDSVDGLEGSQSPLEAINTRLDTLRQQLATVEASTRALRQSSSLKTTRADLVTLENDIFDTARALTAINMDINTLKLSYNQDLKRLDELERQLASLRASFTELPLLSTQDLAKSSPRAINDRARIVKMKLLDSLGLSVDLEQAQVTILNKELNKLTSLHIDNNYSDYFISNYIWDNM